MVERVPGAAPEAELFSGAIFDLPRLKQQKLVSARGLEYRIIVNQPSAPPPAEGYPVIYVLDGNAWASIISEVIRANQMYRSLASVEPAVVVGIGYPNAEAFDLDRRFYDLTTPWPDADLPALFGRPDAKLGGADEFFEFIEHELKPIIERHFSVDRSRQVLFGHSLGGFFALRTLLMHPGSFKSFIAISPALLWEDGGLLRDYQALEELADDTTGTRPRAFVGVGDIEQHLRPSDVEALRREIATSPHFSGQDPDEAVEGFLKKVKHWRYVDNASDVANCLDRIGVETRFVNFLDEDHFSVLPPAISRSLPFAIS